MFDLSAGSTPGLATNALHFLDEKHCSWAGPNTTNAVPWQLLRSDLIPTLNLDRPQGLGPSSQTASLSAWRGSYLRSASDVVLLHRSPYSVLSTIRRHSVNTEYSVRSPISNIQYPIYKMIARRLLSSIYGVIIMISGVIVQAVSANCSSPGPLLYPGTWPRTAQINRQYYAVKNCVSP